MTDSMSLDKVVDLCLDRLREGDSVAACLADYPEYAEQLAPLLETAVALQTWSPPALSAAGRAAALDRARKALRAQQAEREPQSRSSRFLQPFPRRFQWAFAVLALLVMLGSGVSRAQVSVPGDLLYGLKRGAEEVRLRATRDPAERAYLRLAFAGHRLDESLTLIRTGRMADDDVTVALELDYQRAWEAIEALPPTRQAELVREYNQVLLAHRRQLDEAARFAQSIPQRNALARAVDVHAAAAARLDPIKDDARQPAPATPTAPSTPTTTSVASPTKAPAPTNFSSPPSTPARTSPPASTVSRPTAAPTTAPNPPIRRADQPVKPEPKLEATKEPKPLLPEPAQTSKTEQPKAEQPIQPEPKQPSRPTPDRPMPEQSKPEQPKPDKTEPARPSQPEPEQPTPEQPKSEQPVPSSNPVEKPKQHPAEPKQEPTQPPPQAEQQPVQTPDRAEEQPKQSPSQADPKRDRPAPETEQPQPEPPAKPDKGAENPAPPGPTTAPASGTGSDDKDKPEDTTESNDTNKPEDTGESDDNGTSKDKENGGKGKK